MKDALRRLTITGLILLVALAALALLDSGNSRYGLFDLLSGKKNKQTFTAPEKSLIDTSEVPWLAKEDAEVTHLVEKVQPAIVSIKTQSEIAVRRGFFGVERFSQPGEGSGVLISKEGHIVTNYHVIKRAKRIEVIDHNDRSHPVELIGANPQVDIAVLRILKTGENSFPALRFANSDALKVGQTVFAFGSPFGLSRTVTKGILCARERRFTDNSTELLQTDAVINPGNSGGPLVNLQGDIIGINVAIFSGEKQTGLWQGVGLAIASNDVNLAVRSITQKGRPVSGYLGIYVPRKDAYVSDVDPGSPAELAGILPGDIITHFDQRKIDSNEELLLSVKTAEIGKVVEIIVDRGGESKSLRVKIGEFDPDAQLAAASRRIENGQKLVSEALGIKVRDLSDEERKNVGDGVIVTQVIEGGPMSDRLEEGDLISGINGNEFGTAREFAARVEAARKGGVFWLEVARKDWDQRWRGGRIRGRFNP